MTKVRKIRIMSRFQGEKPEHIDTAMDQDEARFLVREYRTAFGPDFFIYCRY